MGEVTEYKAGTFNWVDLATSDPESAKQFYTELFGWSYQDFPTENGNSDYTMFNVNEHNVAALYEMGKEQKVQQPSQWTSYISVDNADEIAKKAKSLGGSIMMEPMDVMDSGRMAMIQDPGGAHFAIWQPNTHIGAGLVNEPNSLCWNELSTGNFDACDTFYTQLFGWTSEDQPGDNKYKVISNGDCMNGGIIEMNEEWEGIPTHWMAFFAVDDCDASVDKAQELGGKISVPPTDIPNIGRFSVINDPQGAFFTVIKLESPE